MPAHAIDLEKWDACVANSGNGFIYSRSFYLNLLTDNWSGLVINDYEAIMPLPWRKKWGIRYLYTPPFVQQLGIIGATKTPETQLYQAIHSFSNYGSYLFNYQNIAFTHRLEGALCNNYVIDLNKDYNAIKASYKKSFGKNVNRASHQHLTYQSFENIEEAIQLFYQYNQDKVRHVAIDSFNALKAICKQLSFNNLVLRKVVNSTDELQSIVLLLKDNKRYYNLINYTTEAGRKNEANYFLYDHLLQELSSQNMIFDFEGSDLPGVKSFYESTGAINQPYFKWHFNKLPWPIHLLKR
ncbi:MAG: hypothetical protein QM541_02785 [Flavobacterium sp.]|nr:hypothetical protein [Flavobacterium sp.]